MTGRTVQGALLGGCGDSTQGQECAGGCRDCAGVSGKGGGAEGRRGEGRRVGGAGRAGVWRGGEGPEGVVWGTGPVARCQ